MEEGKISVIVPIYKVENYLNRCVESIRKQTYRNLEIILVDDGSPDACGEMCDRYAQEDSRIRVIHKENGGLSDARNAGIEVPAGEYIAFIDSDDWIDDKMYVPIQTSTYCISGRMIDCAFSFVHSFLRKFKTITR